MTYSPRARAFCCAAALALATAMPMAAQAVTLTLNFGSSQQPTFGKGTDLEMRFDNAATGVNVSLTAAGTFPSSNASNNGSTNGDLRINMSRGNSQVFTLAVWDANEGLGYETALSGTFDWDLMFYDLDGDDSSRDIVTLMSPATYTVTTTTDLTIDKSVPGQVKFIGGGAPNVPQVNGNTLSQDQADISVSAQVSNLSSLTFMYEATGSRNARNLVVDGGNLSFGDIPTVSGPVSAVPVPLPAVLLLTGIGALALGSRRRGRDQNKAA